MKIIKVSGKMSYIIFECVSTKMMYLLKLLNNISESDLSFSYSGGDTSITYNNDLLAIVEDIASASDITFI